MRAQQVRFVGAAARMITQHQRSSALIVENRCRPGRKAVNAGEGYKMRLNHHIDNNAPANASVAPIAAKIEVTSVGC